MAEKFTGLPGVYVPLEETLRGFEAILSGEMDGYPEMAFYNVGTLDDALAKAKKMEAGKRDEDLSSPRPRARAHVF